MPQEKKKKRKSFNILKFAQLSKIQKVQVIVTKTKRINKLFQKEFVNDEIIVGVGALSIFKVDARIRI